eukprot:gene2763-biopygen2726
MPLSTSDRASTSASRQSLIPKVLIDARKDRSARANRSAARRRMSRSVALVTAFARAALPYPSAADSTSSVTSFANACAGSVLDGKGQVHLEIRGV